MARRLSSKDIVARVDVPAHARFVNPRPSGEAEQRRSRPERKMIDNVASEAGLEAL